MNKLASVFVVSLAALLMSSCFLFRSHEDCPAYGSNEIKKEIKKENVNSEALLTDDQKS